MRVLKMLPLCAALSGLAGCALVQPVQPWEKGRLARPEMSFQGSRMETKYDEHVYASKEAAAGGASIGGGGCGCN